MGRKTRKKVTEDSDDESSSVEEFDEYVRYVPLDFDC